tara:strand:- start:79 stop:681 length:603 start_codon:yes stop_codon:yes gene_type:complete
MIKYLREHKDISDISVLNAMLNVPRHLFLDSSFLEFAYQDKAFPIGSDQTISSVYTVAFQTELLNIQAKDRVLEIGTGSGYQTAVLCEIGAKVYSIERHLDLYKKAKRLLKSLNYHPTLVHGDGYLGLENEALFDKIIVTCGATEVPPFLMQQLKIGGLMIIPLGFKEQMMTTIIKLEEGKIKKIEYENFRFVPFLRNKQ